MSLTHLMSKLNDLWSQPSRHSRLFQDYSVMVFPRHDDWTAIVSPEVTLAIQKKHPHAKNLGGLKQCMLRLGGRRIADEIKAEDYSRFVNYFPGIYHIDFDGCEEVIEVISGSNVATIYSIDDHSILTTYKVVHPRDVVPVQEIGRVYDLALRLHASIFDGNFAGAYSAALSDPIMYLLASPNYHALQLGWKIFRSCAPYGMNYIVSCFERDDIPTSEEIAAVAISELARHMIEYHDTHHEVVLSEVTAKVLRSIFTVGDGVMLIDKPSVKNHREEWDIVLSSIHHFFSDKLNKADAIVIVGGDDK